MRQTSTYTCGPASVVVIIRMLESIDPNLDIGMCERSISTIMRTRPRKGTEIDEIVSYMKKMDFLKDRIESYGANTYHGGIAIANIRNWRSGGGHYVVFLGEDSRGMMMIYDVISGRVHYKRKSEFEWSNGDKTSIEWSLNIRLSEDEQKSAIEYIKSIDDPMVHIIIGEDDDDRSLSDNARYLKKRYEDKNHQVNIARDSTITIFGNTLRLGATEVKKGDTVWVKMDPVPTERYFLILRMLVPFENRGIKFVNPPSLILAYDDKIIPLTVGGDDRFFGVADTQVAQGSFWMKERSKVVKDLSMWGGNNIWFYENPEDAVNKKTKGRPFILEKDGRNILEDINTRIIWYKGEIVGVVDRERFPDDLGRRTRGEEVYENNDLRKKIEDIGKFLKEKRFIIAEISILNFTRITKVIVSNPGTIKIYIELSGDNFIEP